MTDPNALALLYRNDRTDGGLRIRIALLGLAAELCPDADDATVLVDAEFGESRIRNGGPLPWVRHSILGTAHNQRLRLGRLVACTFPDVRKAYAVFLRGGEGIAAVELPVTF